MKKILFTCVLFFMGMSLYAQNSMVKDVRQTYLWDVTLSMQGRGAGAIDIWDNVKKAIISDIQQISDDRTEIVVIPFQHIALDEWREYATSAGKAALIAKIKAYRIPLFNFNGRMTTMTCLYHPLQFVVDNVLSSDKVDILKLMTDGIPDEHQTEYEELLSRWCQIAKDKDAFGFYIMLTPQAVEGYSVLKEIEPCRFGVVNVANLRGTNISTLMLVPQESIAFSVREENSEKLTMRFSHNGSGQLQDGYRVRVYSSENQYMKVDQIVEVQSNYTVTVEVDFLLSKEQMRTILPVERNETIQLFVEPANGMDQYPYGMTQINKDTPTVVELINKPEKTVKFHVL